MAVEAGGIGARLRAGREKLGLTVLQVAERIHTDPKIVDAIEAESYETLGAPVYARGHIRHYADLVGESASELVQIYSNLAKVEQPDLTRIVKAPAGPDSSKLVAPALVVVAVFAVAGAIWWISALSKKKPQMSETHVVTDEGSVAASAPHSDSSGSLEGATASGVTAGGSSTDSVGSGAEAVAQGVTPGGGPVGAAAASGDRKLPAGATVVQPRAGATDAAGRAGTTGPQSSAARSNNGAGSATGPGAAIRAPYGAQTTYTAPPSTAPASSVSSAAATRAAPSAAPPAAAPTKRTASSAPATVGAPPTRTSSSAPLAAAAPSKRTAQSAPATTAAPTKRAATSAPLAAAAQPTRTASAAPAMPAPEPAAATRPKNQSSVTLRYSADSWTEVYDASGARLYYDVGPANSVQTVVGTAPLRVVLGNASGVSVEYNGHSKPIAKLSRPDGSVQFSITRSGEVVRAKPVADGG